MKIAVLFFASLGYGQIIVSMDALPSKGTAAQLGRGQSATAYNLHVCGLGPSPVPFTLVRINFPEVRFYSAEQQADILKERIAQSWPARIMKYTGYATAGVGIGYDIAKTFNKDKSASQFGNLMTVGGLAVPVIMALTTKATPNYSISNPPPETIALGLNVCAEYTALAAYGKSAVTIPTRRIDALR